MHGIPTPPAGRRRGRRRTHGQGNGIRRRGPDCFEVRLHLSTFGSASDASAARDRALAALASVGLVRRLRRSP